FINMLDQMQNSSFELDNQVAALVDVNHFSDINDGLGQDAGNLLLIAIAERLQGAMGPEVKMGRIGADVFGLIGRDNKVCPEYITNVFNSPFKAGDHTLPVNVTVGLCRLLDEENNGLNILKQSNIALNRAKKSLTANYEYYAPEMEEKTTWRLGMIRQLRSDFAER
ncbi:GGDEF domain-containing protein, partial [Bowmanella dokdonensis]